jgi:hypothetical protein
MTSIGDATRCLLRRVSRCRTLCICWPVEAQEQVRGGVATPVGNPALSAMIRRVVKHVAALAEALEITQPVVGGIMIEVRGGQYDPRGAPRNHRQQVRPARPPAMAIAPGLLDGIEPSSVRQTANQMRMRPAAALAPAAGALKPNPMAEFLPVRRIK